MNLEFNSTHDIIMNSYKNETSKWLNTYHNSFNYLLWTIGRIRSKDDNTNFRMKQFNTLMLNMLKTFMRPIVINFFWIYADCT